MCIFDFQVCPQFMGGVVGWWVAHVIFVSDFRLGLDNTHCEMS